MKFNRWRQCAVAVAIASFAVGSPSRAQTEPPEGAQRASRSHLAEKLAQLEKQIGTVSGSDRQRLIVSREAIRSRLETGDFRAGDRFVMTLRQESVRSDTLVVRDSFFVAVLNLPEFSVKGVLRSELEERLQAHVSRFLKNAAVRTTLLVRVSLTGAVYKPGFYYAIPDRPLNDLLTIAGGPAVEADLSKITISRQGKTLLGGKASRKLLEEGRTLEELDVQSGDTVNIPVKKKFNWQLAMQMFFVISSLFFAGVQFLQWYYNRKDQ